MLWFLGVIIKRKSGEIPCPLAVEAFAAHLSYICKYDDKYSKWVYVISESVVLYLCETSSQNVYFLNKHFTADQ